MERKDYKKIIFSMVAVMLLMGVIGGTYAFFNYTRTGTANIIRTGRINFNSEQGTSINLTNLFPIDVSEGIPNDNTKVGTVTINVTGDTTYGEGIEYLVSAVNVTNTVGSKSLPISIDVEVASNTNNDPATTLGTSSSNYFTNRGSTTSYYKVLASDVIENNEELVVGYIAPGQTGVDGNIVIRAYLDEDKIAISDTYPNQTIRTVKTTDYNSSDCVSALTGMVNANIPCATASSLQNAIDNNQLTSSQIRSLVNAGIVEEYTDGTTSEWVGNRETFTTTEWNSLQTNGVSFGVKVEANEGIWVDNPNVLYNTIKRNVNTETLIDFSINSSSTNGEGIYILPGTETDTNPIYYYRGAVTNNNVIFGDYCWQIVRTTDTGGVKMIYNGVATGNGETCENTTHASRKLSNDSAFNSASTSVSDVGYMSNARYTYTSGITRGAIFGRNIEWDGENYLVIDEIANTPSTNTTGTGNNYHYSCGTVGVASCSEVRYYFYNNYYITLTGGDTVEDALYKMTGNGSASVKQKNNGYVLNQNDSLIKTAIESWFRTNLTNEVDNTKRNYASYIEDTVYCNDRSFKTNGANKYTQSGWNPNGGNLSTYLYFGTFNRFNNSWYSTSNVPTVKNSGEVPNVACPNETDRFSVSSSVAHLNYPVGLLTADEVIMAGASGDYTQNNTYYLYTNGDYWIMSPNNAYRYIYGFGIRSSGGLTYGDVGYTNGVRPVISLKSGIEYESGGDGTPTNPYVVKYE